MPTAAARGLSDMSTMQASTDASARPAFIAMEPMVRTAGFAEARPAATMARPTAPMRTAKPASFRGSKMFGRREAAMATTRLVVNELTVANSRAMP